MIVRASALACALSLAAAGADGEPAGVPQTAFDAFKTFCAAYQGDNAAAEAQARAMGFTASLKHYGGDPAAPPTPILTPPAPAAYDLVFLGDRDEARGARATRCRIIVTDPDHALAKGANAWPGIQPTRTFGPQATYIYRQTPTGRVALSQPDSNLPANIQGGEMRVLIVTAGPQISVVDLATYIPDPPQAAAAKP
ncbi:hypothetical protein QO010_004314 [Caulobacter ginsengisoli]|uniref:Uncharacterized protein n=1 Tax=Caulobacter ginsengisoli TaxID=400775 RepID=A0ABU0IWZ2_9CAUL|nr:hypothetical protein [Caulobacter ginsengisoli]MDQ0466519.1 hypothetical protein [Caulobacter ginsengisoli]